MSRRDGVAIGGRVNISLGPAYASKVNIAVEQWGSLSEFVRWSLDTLTDATIHHGLATKNQVATAMLKGQIEREEQRIMESQRAKEQTERLLEVQQRAAEKEVPVRYTIESLVEAHWKRSEDDLARLAVQHGHDPAEVIRLADVKERQQRIERARVYLMRQEGRTLGGDQANLRALPGGETE